MVGILVALTKKRTYQNDMKVALTKKQSYQNDMKSTKSDKKDDKNTKKTKLPKWNEQNIYLPVSGQLSISSMKSGLRLSRTATALPEFVRGHRML